MMRKAIQASIFLIIGVILVACGNGGPEPGFDVTGLWTEQGGGSTLEFTEAGGYALHFDPWLNDGTSGLEGESYNRVDNGHLTFMTIMGPTLRGSLIKVEATINSSNVLRFKLGGKTYRFIKTSSGVESAEPIATPTPVPPTATPTPTPVPPTATPTPIVIAGIDEPIVVEGITVQGLMGATTTGDLTLLLLAAYTEESLEDREGKAIYPENSSDVYLTLMLKWEGPSGSLNWLVRNGRLESGGQVYPVERAGDEYAAGIWKGSFLICPIPRESEYGSYRLELPDGQGIDLSPFFGDPGQPTALRTPTPAPPTATPTPVTPTRRVPIHTPTPTPLPTATRDVSTLDKALLGHWVTESGVTDFYFSPGTLIQDEPSGIMHLTWTMLEQNETENWMRIQVQRPDTGGGHEKMLRFASDRKSLVAETTIAQKWLYVDNKQKP